MVGIAPVEIATESDRHVCVAGVIGSVHHEFAQGSKVTLDAVEVAGRGRRRYQLNIVDFGPCANLRCPVQRQVVVNQVEAQVIGIAAADVLVERKHLVCGFARR